MSQEAAAPSEDDQSDDQRPVPGPVLGPDPRFELVLTEARRAIEQQVRDLESVRARAGGLATLGLGSGTFLVGVIVNGALETNWLTWAGFVALVAAVLTGLGQLRPRTFSFTLNVREFAKRALVDDVDTLTRAAAVGLQADATSNQKALDVLLARYPRAVALFVSGIAAIAASLL